MESGLVTSQVAPARHEARVRELDGIRALAIWSVMAAHLLVVTPALTHTASGLPHWLSVVIDHGWLGVDLFFVLSGFLITSILLASKRNGPRRYFGRFYERRALRILPLYVLMLVLLALAYIPLTGGAYFVMCLAFVANLAPLVHAAIPNGAGPMWSLAVEEQFYLLWPLLVLTLDRSKLWIVLLAVVIAEPLMRATHPDAHLEYTWFRCDGLAWGALLALWFSSPRRSLRADGRLAAGLAALAVIITAASIPLGGMHGGAVSTATRIDQALCVFAALVVFAVSRTGSAATRWLRSPFALLTADFSYCLYLIHVPLIDAYQTAVLRFAPRLPDHLGALGANLLRAAVVLTVAYGLAAVSRRYIELPFLNMGRSAARPAPVTSAALS